eukprot:1679434-Rhodomonas_salina.3
MSHGVGPFNGCLAHGEKAIAPHEPRALPNLDSAPTAHAKQDLPHPSHHRILLLLASSATAQHHPRVSTAHNPALSSA